MCQLSSSIVLLKRKMFLLGKSELFYFGVFYPSEEDCIYGRGMLFLGESVLNVVVSVRVLLCGKQSRLLCVRRSLLLRRHKDEIGMF